MEYIEQLIAKYLSGTLSEEEITVLRRWIDENPERRNFIRSLESRSDLVKKYNRYAAVDTESAKRRFLRYVRPVVFSPFSRRVWYYAAVLVSLVVLSVWLYEKEPPGSPQFTLEQVDPGATQAILIMDNGTELALTDQEEKTIALDDSVSAQMGNGAITYRPVAKKTKAEYHTIVVPRGGEYRITLADGTSVHINAESQLRFPVTFSDEERTVQLTGEAYFEVSHRENTPFVVEVGNMRVRQYGTKFNINAYDEVPEVVLVSGSIGVSGADREEVTLAPGQLAVCGEHISVTNVDVAPYIGWTEGRFTFENERLADIVPELMRWYDVEIKIFDDTVADLRFTGSVGRYETIEHIMKAISYTQGVSVAVTGNKIEISK